MIVYSVTVSIDNGVREDWLRWMQEVHIPEVMATGNFAAYHLHELLEPESEAGSSTFNVQYLCHSMEAYTTYREQHAPVLQKEHQLRYQGRFVAFRTLLRRL